MTLEEFVAKWEPELRSILLAGYFCDEKDYAMRYRKMNTEMALLRMKLHKMHNELFPPVKPEANGHANNKPGTPLPLRK